jgi:hypothetical protein
MRRAPLTGAFVFMGKSEDYPDAIRLLMDFTTKAENTQNSLYILLKTGG